MKRLQNRLILAFLFVILVTVCGVSTALLVIFRNTPLEDRIAFADLDAQAEFIVQALRHNPRLELSNRETTLLDRFMDQRGIRVAWANADRIIVYDSEQRWDEPSLQDTSSKDVFRALKKQPRTQDRWRGEVYENAERWLIVAHPVPSDKGVRGYVLVARLIPPFQFLRRFLDTMATPLFQAGLVALALGVVLAQLISRSIARPLQKVADAARGLAAGNLDARAPIEGTEEVRDVARTFNDMAQQVQASQQAQRDLVANVAHDLRTPLASIQGFAQALVDGTASTSEAQTHAAHAIYEEALRMHRMTQSLLDLARFEAGEINLKLTLVDLSALVEKRLTHFAPQAEQSGISLSADMPTSVEVLGDSGRLEQVLDNLLSNALTHTVEGGRVTVTVAQDKAASVLAVADTGEGIPPEALQRIFERFYRGDKARGGSGTGLGLAIVQEIVKAHNGTIHAESVVGVGSKFTVRLPLHQS